MVGIPSTPFRAPESAYETGASAVQVGMLSQNKKNLHHSGATSA